jgi:hypothetical protein
MNRREPAAHVGKEYLTTLLRANPKTSGGYHFWGDS